MIELTDENYHSRKANKQYMSVSLLKSFLPWFPFGCEAKTMAELNGRWDEPDSPALLLGNYVHAWNEGKLPEFRANTPQLFKKNGDLYAKYKRGDEMINTLKNDEYMMKVLQGGKEEILTAELFGVPWKCKIDVLNDDFKTFTDLKTTREIGRDYYNPFMNEYQNFIEYYGYDFQMALYAEIIRKNRKAGKYYMPHIAAVDKQSPPDKMVIHFGTEFIKPKLNLIEDVIDHVIDVWKGNKKPERCGQCDYCRATKQIKKSVHFKEL